MSAQSFDVTYQLSLGNLNAFFGAWWERTWFDKGNWKRFSLYTLAITVLHIFALQGIAHTIFKNTAFNVGWMAVLAIVAVLLSAVYAFILVFLLSPLVTYVAQLLVFVFGPARKKISIVKANTDGIDKAMDQIVSQMKWRDVVSVVETRKAVLLFINRNSATIVPKSAFASPAEAEAFAAFAKARWQDAHSVF
jgi:hypothetical protein